MVSPHHNIVWTLNNCLTKLFFKYSYQSISLPFYKEIIDV